MNIVYIPRRVKHTSFSRLPPTEDSASESTASLEYEPPPKQTRIVYLFLTSIFIFFLFSLSFWMGTRWAAHPPSSILNWKSITEYCPLPFSPLKPKNPSDLAQPRSSKTSLSHTRRRASTGRF
jgi:hypothetical protein